MKILFISNLMNISASGHQRLWAIEQNGVKVKVVDKGLFRRTNYKYINKVACVLKNPSLGIKVNELESTILSEIITFKPDIIWYEWPKEVGLSFFHKIKNLDFSPFLISFQDDNPWGDRLSDEWQWKNYFHIAPVFDLHLVKRDSDVKNLKRIGAKLVMKWKHGVFTPMFNPNSGNEQKEYKLSFVGTCMENRGKLVNQILHEGIPIHIFGNGWERLGKTYKKYYNYFHKEVEGKEYANMIRQSQMCLGLVSHSNKDEWSMRTYEVPGCAGMLIAERTKTHINLYEENKEAIYFSSNEECIAKIQEYINNPNECKKIGEAAYNKCLDNDWFLNKEMKKLLDLLSNEILPSYNS